MSIFVLLIILILGHLVYSRIQRVILSSSFLNSSEEKLFLKDARLSVVFSAVLFGTKMRLILRVDLQYLSWIGMLCAVGMRRKLRVSSIRVKVHWSHNDRVYATLSWPSLHYGDVIHTRTFHSHWTIRSPDATQPTRLAIYICTRIADISVAVRVVLCPWWQRTGACEKAINISRYCILYNGKRFGLSALPAAS